MELNCSSFERTARRGAVRAFALLGAMVCIFHTSAFADLVQWTSPDIDSYFYNHVNFGGQASYAPTWGQLETDGSGNILPPTEDVGATRHSQLLLAFQTSPEIETGLPASRYDVSSVTVTIKLYQSAGESQI